MRPFISLCMIVKNEEKVIDRCLSSISHLVEEVIIVDTGSDDNTKKIVSNYTSNIYDFDWINDFSAARNFAASKASGEWILVLDADEYVDEENFKEFIKKLRADDNQFDSYCAKILNFTGSYGESLIQNFHDRIYKNNGEIRFYRKIHEQFENVTGKPLKIENSNLLIFHSGYLNNTVAEKNKNQRNKELIDEEMETGNNNSFDYFNRGNEYCSIGNYEKALDAYLEAYKYKKDFRLAWVSTTLIQIVVCLINLKRFNDALNVIQDAESIYSNSPEFVYLKAEIFLQKGQLEDAKKMYQLIINNQDEYYHIIFRPDLKDQKPHQRLGEIFLAQGKYNESIYHYMSVLNINMYNEESIKKIIYILDKYHSIEEIERFLEQNNLINQKNLQSYIKACLSIANLKLALKLIDGFVEDNKLLYEIVLFKKLCMGDLDEIESLEEVMNVQVLSKLLETNWINIIDLVLLDEHANNENSLISILEPFKQVKEYKMLIDFVEGYINVGEIEGSVLIFAIQTLLAYKKYSLLDLLLENIETTNKEIISKVAGILYSYGYKGEALQLYELSDWDQFKSEDFINIIEALLETDDKENAIKIAQYANSIYTSDFRFYQYILENTSNLDLFKLTMVKAKNEFPESIFLAELEK